MDPCQGNRLPSGAATACHHQVAQAVIAPAPSTVMTTGTVTFARNQRLRGTDWASAVR
ncbi:hypothetical protein ACIOD1_33395 [Streptomyces sp. NPDC088097]|uniref:hypothetical protein n=1 Tax=Streptomyces sp. NPDC088097 TaxID=3365823 RepID=UPI00382C4547